ncbi:hypothetical protein MRX96_020100 [Rhipicephalus microplus]
MWRPSSTTRPVDSRSRRLRNRPGFVRTLFVEGVNFDVRPGSNLDLNEVRMNNFKMHIANFLREELYMNIYGNYHVLLNQASARMSFALS